jgi:glycosyltransferase involved in cell wall biosynthesis
VTWLWRIVVSCVVLFIDATTWLMKAVRSAAPPMPEDGIRIVLTGTFYTDNWLTTHLVPLAQARSVGVIYMVATRPVPDIEGVVAVYPADWMRKIFGSTGARLLTFVTTTISKQPHIAGGFHLLLNGLLARMLAAMTRCRSLYICGGGMREVEGGGYKTENRLFNKLRYASELVEKRLIAAVNDIDYVITMGSSVKQCFEELGARGTVSVIPGGFDGDEWSPAPGNATPEYDLVTVSRLSQVKRLDLMIDAMALCRKEGVTLKAVIVGDGPLIDELRQQASDKGLTDQVHFPGWQDNVVSWLRKSRIFVLTSESEGLSQAMIQGMLCALPAVVSDVGDLSDVVVDKENGALVRDLESSSFASAFCDVVADDMNYERLSASARRAAMELSIENTARRWEQLLAAAT